MATITRMIHFMANSIILEKCAFKKRDYYKPELKLNGSFEINTGNICRNLKDTPSADVN